MNIFGKRKSDKPAAPSAEQTATVIQSLRQKLDMLEKRENHVQRKIDAQYAEARARSAKKDKRGALMALKRKGLYEKEIAKYQGARLTLEQQIIALEGAAVNVDTFAAMRAGAQHMAAIHNNLSIDSMDDVMDEINEQMARAEEISQAIATPLGGGLEDDEDLLRQLDEMEEMDMESNMLAAPAAPVGAVAAPAPAVAARAPMPELPSAPTGPVAGASAAEMAELAALEASMA